MDKKEALNRIIFLIEELEESRQRLQKAGTAAVDIELALLNQQVLSLYKQIQQYHKAEATTEPVIVPRPEPYKPKETPLPSFRVPIETRQEAEPKKESPRESFTPPVYHTLEPDVVELPNEAPAQPVSEKPSFSTPAPEPVKEVETEPANKWHYAPQSLEIKETAAPEKVKEEASIPADEYHEPMPAPEPEPVTETPVKEETPIARTPEAQAPVAEPKGEPARPDIASIYAQAREKAAQTESTKKQETLADRLHSQQHDIRPMPQPTQPAYTPPAPEPQPVAATPPPVSMPEPEQPKPAPEAPPVIKQEQPASEPVRQEPPVARPEPQATPSLNERLGTQHVKRNLADKLKLSPIADLRTAISLNQRVAFIKQLFGGDEKEFKRVINFVNSCRNYSEAKMFMQTEVSPVHKWSDENPLVEDFMELVYRKFL